MRLRSWRRFVRRCLIFYCFIISLLAFGKYVHKKLQFAFPVIIKIERLNFSRKLKKITLKLITGRRGIAKQLCYISEFNKKEWTRQHPSGKVCVSSALHQQQECLIRKITVVRNKGIKYTKGYNIKLSCVK